MYVCPFLNLSHLSLLLPFLTSKPYIKTLPFLLSFRTSFKLVLAKTCFLKFCKILVPFYFFSLLSDIMASSNCFLLNWLTFILKVRFLSNYLPSYPLIIPVLQRKNTLEKIHHCRVFCAAWFSPFDTRHDGKEFVKFNFAWSILVNS